MQAAGFYYRTNMANNWGPTIFNTFLGDPARLVILEAVLNYINDNNLTENARITGNYIKSEVEVCKFPKENF